MPANDIKALRASRKCLSVVGDTHDLVNCDYVYDYLCQEGYVIVIVCLFVQLKQLCTKLPNGFA